jgi:hypothetical protein
MEVLKVLSALVFPEDLGSCILVWKTPSRTQECKCNLLKIKEGKYIGRHGEAQLEARSQEHVSACHEFLKSAITYGKGRTERIPANNQ